MTSTPPGGSADTGTEQPDHATPVTSLTSGKLLAGNSLWNLAGTSAPILVAILCMPVLKRDLGVERLGIITLAWAVIGYFGLFDLGLSRALTKLIAEKMVRQQMEEIPPLVWTSLLLMTGMSIIGSVITFLGAPWLVERLLKVSPGIHQETLHSFYWIGASIPLVVSTAGLRGVLEALQEFRLATAIRLPMGVYTFLGPVLVLPFSHSLVAVMIVLVAGRIAAWLAHLLACLHVMPGLKTAIGFNRSFAGPLLRFGTWMTVSNIVGPLMVTFDRFVVGAMISVAAVAYYSVPYEVVTKMWLIPTALVGVLFPAFSATSETDRARLIFLYECGVKYLLLALFPATLILITIAPEALGRWMGADFGQNSAPVAQALAIAVFLNSLAQVPFTHVQGAGRPDLTAKLHLFELPFYMGALFILARSMGLQGVALAWLARVAIDTVVMFVFSWYLLPQNRFVATRVPALAGTAVACFVAVALLRGAAARYAIAGVICLAALPAMWFWMLSPRERSPLESRLLKVRKPGATSGNCASVTSHQ